MSAAVGPHLWFKDVTNGFNLPYSEIEFAELPAKVSHLKGHVRDEFMWQGQRKDAISLFLVPIEAGQDQPNDAQEQTAIATGPLLSTKSLADVNVKSGCFLLAKCSGLGVAGELPEVRSWFVRLDVHASFCFTV